MEPASAGERAVVGREAPTSSPSRCCAGSKAVSRSSKSRSCPHRRVPGLSPVQMRAALACLEAGRPDEAAASREIADGGDQTLPRDNGWLFG
jgi:hypothetical protein